MKRILIKLKRDQQGMMLVSVTLLVCLTGLLLAPLLAFMSTGMKTARIQETRTDQLYAAEAGVERALWMIQENAHPDLPRVPSDDPYTTVLDSAVNGMDVSFTITRPSATVYKVESTAVNPDTGTTTSIEVSLKLLDLSCFTNDAISCPGSISVGSNSHVSGDIWTPNFPAEQESQVSGTIDRSEVTDWPDGNQPAQIDHFYRKQVNTYAPHTAVVIDASNPAQSGPLYVYNELIPDQTYELRENGYLNGTIYVDGNLKLGNVDKNSRLELRGHTIFVRGNLVTDPKITLVGPGVIIALGHIDFQPQLDSSKYIFIMSVGSDVNFQPNSAFVGSVAGKITVNVQPNCALDYPDGDPPGSETGGAPSDLNLPGFDDNAIAEIHTWIIK
jgi:hypothetical protein